MLSESQNPSRTWNNVFNPWEGCEKTWLLNLILRELIELCAVVMNQLFFNSARLLISYNHGGKYWCAYDLWNIIYPYIRTHICTVYSIIKNQLSFFKGGFSPRSCVNRNPIKHDDVTFWHVEFFFNIQHLKIWTC